MCGMSSVTDTAEWKQLKELAILAANAVVSDDDALERHYREEIRRVGDHMLSFYDRDPIVLETLADFTSEFSEATRFYEEAIQLLDASGGDSTSPRMSLAELILDNGGDSRQVSGLINSVDETHLSPDDMRRLIVIRNS